MIPSVCRTATGGGLVFTPETSGSILGREHHKSHLRFAGRTSPVMAQRFNRFYH
jgi:hypothetical protein